MALIFPKGCKTLVGCDRERYRTDSRLVGPVKIGGKRYDCIAVECTQLAKPTIHVGEVIGLVVQSARCPFRATLGRNGTIGGLHIATIMQLRADTIIEDQPT